MKSSSALRLSLSPAHRLLALAMGLSVAGCTRSGVLDAHLPTAYFYDSEPNDDSSNPQPIGPVYPPEQLVIRGHVSCVPGFHLDGTDAFALAAYDPARIHFELDSRFGDADLDLCLVDPFLEKVVGHWDSYGDEYGSFDVPGAGQEFHLVVVAFSGADEYDLELRVDPLPFGAPVPFAPTARPVALDADATSEQSAERAQRLAPYFDGARERRRAEAERAALDHVLAIARERAATGR